VFLAGVSRNSSDGENGTVHIIHAAGAQYRIELEVCVCARVPLRCCAVGIRHRVAVVGGRTRRALTVVVVITLAPSRALQFGGAEGTQRSLRLEADETITMENGLVARAPYANNGPTFTFPAGGTVTGVCACCGVSQRSFSCVHVTLLPHSAGIWYVRRGVLAPEVGAGGSGAHGGKNTGVTPRRVTVYVRMAHPVEGSLVSHWGAHLCLHEWDFRPVSNDTGFQERPVDGNYPNATGGNGPGTLPGCYTHFCFRCVCGLFRHCRRSL
jgi:hypothetical protein